MLQAEAKQQVTTSATLHEQGERNKETAKMNTRQATNKLLEYVEEGLLDKDTVIMACVKYMSEDDVADMCHVNEFFYGDEEGEE